MTKTITPPRKFDEALELERIDVNPEQPRKYFDDLELNELAQTIREHGVIEPIVVEYRGAGRYTLHDGERRFRAAKLAGLTHLPARIMPGLNGTGPQTRLEVALVANVQRQDMTPVERALAVQRLRKEFGKSVTDISKRIGRSETLVRQDLALAELVKHPRAFEIMQSRRLSTEPRVVAALQRVEPETVRVLLMQKLADKRASARIVVAAANKALNMGKQRRGSAAETPAQKLAAGMRELPEYDALYQLGRVPPWAKLNDAVMSTCDGCALRPMAGPAVCGPCALVRTLEILTMGERYGKN